MVDRLLLDAIVFIPLAFLMALVASFIIKVSGAGKDPDLGRYGARMFSKKWWLYVLVIAMFLIFMPEKDDIGINPQIEDFLTDGVFFLIIGYILAFWSENITKTVEDKTKNQQPHPKGCGMYLQTH
ncbi:MAG: hypothetical protein JW778_02620 [Candidatus Altiarchaeota archaeon]|nr:hypothetical protein [Candidatus Altiarchaeota archaeon]